MPTLSEGCRWLLMSSEASFTDGVVREVMMVDAIRTERWRLMPSLSEGCRWLLTSSGVTRRQEGWCCRHQKCHQENDNDCQRSDNG